MDQRLQNTGGSGLLVDSTDERGDLDKLRDAALPPHRSRCQECDADLDLADDRIGVLRPQVEQLKIETWTVALQHLRPFEEILKAERLPARHPTADL